MMKKLLYIPLIVVAAYACSNDFEVAAPWKETPVAYGILSPQDTAQYIRVEKAFLDPEKSALEIAQIADSLYYPENAISVWLERVSNGQRIPLTRVDGNLEGHVREEGTFADQPNWLYKTKGAAILPAEKYRLVIERTDGKADITAETTVPADFILAQPVLTSTFRQIAFSASLTTTIEWRSDANGAYFNITLILPWREEAPDGTVVSRDTIIWKAATNVERTDVLTGGKYKGATELSGLDLFRLLSKEIPPAGTNFRYFEKGTIIIEGGGKEIKAFNESASANSGITGAEVYPLYTNISEGYGIFTAKNSVTFNNLLIKNSTVDSMFYHPLTQNLKFRY